MMLLESLRDALYSISAHRLRSFLTTMGLVVGITVVIVILSVSGCVSDIVNIYYSGLEDGSCLEVSIIKKNDVITYESLSAMNITLDQCRYFNDQELPDYIYGVELKSNEIYDTTVYSADGAAVSDAVLNGVSPATQYIRKVFLEDGRFISSGDCDNKTSAVVISDVLAEQLYGSSGAALTKEIRMKSADGTAFNGNIVGVYRLTETDIYSAQCTNIYGAYSFVSDIFNEKTETSFNRIKIAYKDDKVSENRASNYICEFFDRFIVNDNYCVAAVPVFTEQESIGKIVSLITAVFTLIAMIIFIISGIELMNTLLISVSERTREIGIRKALGAGDPAIIMQFLAEAVIISLLGIIGGLIMGFAADRIIQINLKDILISALDSKYSFVISNSELTVRPTAFSVFLSSFLALLIGIIFGLSPAKKAMRMSPVDALRSE